MSSLNPGIATPLYVQLATKIRTLIDEGTLKSGDQIMTEVSLVEEYNVSRITVRKAIDLLVNEKVLFRKQGKGTFVAYPDFLENPNIQNRSFTASFLKKESTTYTKLLEKRIISVDESLREKFPMIPDGEKEMICITRLRSIDNHPAVYEIDYLPMRFLSIMNSDLENQSLYGMLHELAGITLSDFSDRFFVIPAKEPYGIFLEVENTVPLLSVLQTVLDEKHMAVYYNQQIINTDYYTYQVQSYI